MIRPLFLLLTFSVLSAAYEPPRPTHDAEIVRFDWRDSTRARDVPVKIYLPKDLSKPCPVVLFSHGLGGSRENYEYLGRHWAGCGYVSVHVQHAGSDDAVWKNSEPGERMKSLRGATMNLANTVNRPRDISFVIDQLTQSNADKSSPLHGRIDLARIGVAGHSYGGFTAMAIAGQAFGPRQSREMADSRVKAVIQMSAPVPRGENGADAAYGPITTPVFHMTGTKDDSPIGDTNAAQRRIPYDHMTSAETCLLIFNGGDHMVFSGAPRVSPAARESDARFHREICDASTAWWDAHLRDDTAARDWLMDGGFAKLLGDDGTFEVHRPKK
jgi:pimeloyl-ACP methyl ester carboxylesterase